MDTRAAAESSASRTESIREPASAPGPGMIFAWTAHPARQRPSHAILALGIIAIVAGFVYVTTASAGLALLGAVILIGALNRFFFPSRFTLDHEGITAAYPLRRLRFQWKNIQRFVWDEYGGYVSTRATPSRLDAYRGMHLLFDETEREQIIARIRQSVQGGDE